MFTNSAKSQSFAIHLARFYTFSVEELHWLVDKISAPSEEMSTQLRPSTKGKIVSLSSPVRSHSCAGKISTAGSVYIDMYIDIHTDICTNIHFNGYIDIEIYTLTSTLTSAFDIGI